MTEEVINPQRALFLLAQMPFSPRGLLLFLSSSVVMMENTKVKSYVFSLVSVHFWVDLFIEEVLCQHKELSVLLSDTMSADELELLKCKLVELILHLPHVRLLQLGDGLFSRRLLLACLPQVGLLTCEPKTLHYSTSELCITNDIDRTLFGTFTWIFVLKTTIYCTLLHILLCVRICKNFSVNDSEHDVNYQEKVHKSKCLMLSRRCPWIVLQRYLCASLHIKRQ